MQLNPAKWSLKGSLILNEGDPIKLRSINATFKWPIIKIIAKFPRKPDTWFKVGQIFQYHKGIKVLEHKLEFGENIFTFARLEPYYTLQFLPVRWLIPGKIQFFEYQAELTQRDANDWNATLNNLPGMLQMSFFNPTKIALDISELALNTDMIESLVQKVANTTRFATGTSQIAAADVEDAVLLAQDSKVRELEVVNNSNAVMYLAISNWNDANASCGRDPGEYHFRLEPGGNWVSDVAIANGVRYSFAATGENGAPHSGSAAVISKYPTSEY